MTTFLEKLRNAERTNKSSLCVGLDPNPKLFPDGVSRDRKGILDFTKRIVDETCDQVIAWKPQISYYAAYGAEPELEALIRHCRSVAPHVPVILDAKRGDIKETAELYAVEAYERYGADGVTIAPYMGFDSIEPFLADCYDEKGNFILGRTSNKTAPDVQDLFVGDPAGDYHVYEAVVGLIVGSWNPKGRNGIVAGATSPEELRRIRQIAGNAPLLVPGVGAQGGDARTVIRMAWRPDAPVVVNSSRGILYAYREYPGVHYGKAAREEAKKARLVMEAAKAEIMNPEVSDGSEADMI